jgi:hypothetical protein
MPRTRPLSRIQTSYIVAVVYAPYKKSGPFFSNIGTSGDAARLRVLLIDLFFIPCWRHYYEDQ